MLHSNSQSADCNQVRIKPNQAQDTSQQKQDIAKELVYFHSIMYNPKILRDPKNTKQRFSKAFWTDKQIKSIKKMAGYTEIRVSQKASVRKQAPKTTETSLEKIKSPNHQISPFEVQFQQYDKFLKTDFPVLKKLLTQKNIDGEEQFNNWVKSMKDKPFFAWYASIRQDGPKTRKISIADETLTILGYDFEQFCLEVEKFTEVTADFVGGEAYQILFINYLVLIRKFSSYEIRGDVDLEKCVSQSYKTVINEIQGKNGASIKVRLAIYMPNMFTIAFEILEVLEQSDSKFVQSTQVRHNRTKEVNLATFKSLSGITRLPQDINPNNTNKVCSYVLIKESSEMKNEQQEKD